jgi:hypothetical protein
MNDSELDQLLDSWKAPAAAQSMRRRLKGKIPGKEWHFLAPPLIWVLAALIGSVVLTVAIAQNRDTGSGILIEIVSQARMTFAEYFLQPREAERAAGIVAKIRQSNPKVYINGELAGPLEYGTAGSIKVRLPDGIYSLMLYRSTGHESADGRLAGWLEAGHIHGKSIEFEADSQRVRIECDEDLVERERGVFIRRIQ